VHLTYQTAFVDENGKLQLRKDVYGRDARMIQILKGSERKVADIGIERKPDPSSRPVRMPVGVYGSGGYYSDPSYGGGYRGSYYSGGYGRSNFFDFIFGGFRFPAR